MTSFRLTVALAAWLMLAGCATVGRPAAGDLEQDRRVLPAGPVVLTVHGLSCPLCSNNLDGQLRRLAGVSAAGINLDTGDVTVNLAPGHTVSAADLATAVQEAGFTLKSIRPMGSNQ